MDKNGVAHIYEKVSEKNRATIGTSSKKLQRVCVGILDTSRLKKRKEDERKKTDTHVSTMLCASSPFAFGPMMIDYTRTRYSRFFTFVSIHDCCVS